MKNKNTNKKQIMVPGGVYDDIDNFYELPDSWNGNRWKFWETKNSDDEKKVKQIYESYKKNGLLDAFPCVTIPNEFKAVRNGKLTVYPKNGRLISDRNRRYKAIIMAIKDGYEIVTEDGQVNKLPYTDQTRVVESNHGPIGDMLTHGKATIFNILNILNVDQEGFSDESVIVGGAECVVEPNDKKIFVYLKDRLKEYTDKSVQGSLTIKVALMAILGRNKLGVEERRNIKINYDIEHNQETSDFNLEQAQKIKKELGGQAPAPFIETFLSLVFGWIKAKHLRYIRKSPQQTFNKNNEPMTTWTIVDKCDKDLFKIEDSEDTSFDKWKEQYEHVVNYIIGPWKKELGKNNHPGNPAAAKRIIQGKVRQIWDYVLEKTA